MRNFTFKILAIAFFALLFSNVDAQWYKCYSDTTPSTLTVDVDTPDGASPDGTVGSYYSWSVAPGGPVLTIGDDIDGPGLNDANEATVGWAATDLGIFTFTATEFNQCDPTTGDQTTIQINRVKPDVTNIIADNSFACGGIPVEITVTGYPGATVAYTLVDALGNTVAGTPGSPITLNTTNGIETITINTTGLPAGNVTFTVANASFSATQPSGAAFNCTNTADLTETTITFEVGDVPTITPIQVVP